MINMNGAEKERSKASTSSTAQRGGERLVVMNHGWQSKSTDGPKGVWSCVFGVVAMVAVVTLQAIAGCSMV